MKNNHRVAQGGLYDHHMQESLFFWVWGWKRNEELTQQIKQDVEKVTGLPYSE